MKTVTLLFEELPASSLGCYGSGLPTPGIDKFAASADLFTNCYASRPSGQIEQWLHSAKALQIDSVEEWESVDFKSLLENEDSSSQIIRFGNRVQLSDADHVINSIQDVLNRTSASTAVVVAALWGQSIEKTTAETGSSEGTITEASMTVGEAHSHVPLLIKLPKQESSRRRTELLTTKEIPHLVDQLLDSVESYAAWRDGLIATQIEYHSEQEQAVRTDHWLLIQPRETDKEEIESMALFRKPEDVWEILNVVDQYPQVIDNYLETGLLDFPND